MKKTYLLAATALLFAACNSGKGNNNESAQPEAEVIEQTETQESDETVMTQLATEIYEHVLNYTDQTPDFLKKHCTAEFLRQLREAYDMDGEGYAIWLMRSGAQDGDGPSTVDTVNILSPDAVELEFTDMGNYGRRILTFEKQKGQWLLSQVTLPNGLSIFELY